MSEKLPTAANFLRKSEKLPFNDNFLEQITYSW